MIESKVTIVFQTLVFHEIRPINELQNQTRPIFVADGYQDALPFPLFDSLSHFKQQMTFLKEENYHTLTLTEIKDYYFQNKPLPEKSILLTFDDCYQSMKEYAYPVLKEAGFKAVAFVVSGWLFSEKSPYNPELSQTLSFADLSEMADVFEYANHTAHFHERKGTTQAKSMWETTEAFQKDLLECNQKVAVKDVFAYPFGLYDQKTLAVLSQMSFSLAFTTKPGINDRNTPALELHRNVVPASMPIHAFEQLVRNEDF